MENEGATDGGDAADNDDDDVPAKLEGGVAAAEVEDADEDEKDGEEAEVDAEDDVGDGEE